MTSRDARLLNAFRPGAELDDPSLFAGRAHEIEHLAKALNTHGACPIIYGDRGLGKSSLALQAWRIAQGDDQLLKRHGLDRWAVHGRDAFLAFYIPCTDATSSTRTILERIITSLTSLRVQGPELRLVDRTTRRTVSLKAFSIENTKKYVDVARTELAEHRNVEDRLTSLTSTLSEVTGRRVAIIIDELDRVRKTAGLASFVKANSSENLKFLLVGIAQNISDLLSDHLSLERITVPVEVKRMTQVELEAIVERALDVLRRDGIEMAFASDASALLARHAAGFPWFVHVIGQEALTAVAGNGRRSVEKGDIAEAMRRLTTNRFTQQFSDLYQRAVRDSLHREMVLRSFAEWKSRDIPTADAYRVLRDRLGVTNPSVYKGHLMKGEYGRVLLTPPYQERGIVRFANEMFKVYVRMRSSLYIGTDEKVRRAFKADSE